MNVEFNLIKKNFHDPRVSCGPKVFTLFEQKFY